MTAPAPDVTRPAYGTADVWGVPFDNGDEIPVFAQSSRVAAVAATALYVEIEGRAPTKVGTPRLWTAHDVAEFVAGVDGEVERARYEGGTPPPRILVDLRNSLARPVDGAHVWHVTPAAGMRLHQVEPYLWRNLVAGVRRPMLAGNAARLLGWILLAFWPLVAKVVWAYGWWRWGWPMSPRMAIGAFLVGWTYTVLVIAETLPWAVQQFTLFPHDDPSA